MAVERRQIHHAVYDFGAAVGLQIQTSAQAAFEILHVLDRAEIDATGRHVESERAVFPVVGRMIVVARQSDASRAVAGFAMRKFDPRGGEGDVGASLREMFAIGGEIFEASPCR